MKTILKDSLFGILIFIVVMLLEFVITIPFGESREQLSKVALAALINRELLLTALPSVPTTFAFAWLLKTKSRRDALRRGMIWACILGLSYAFIGLGNGTFDLIYGTAGVYVLLAGAFAGPVLYAAVKRF